ncbi:GNAT family N-acetyltransferase [Roseivirga sp.]|uniref:GNAT family N-acetyltransferase n=1 Tax=Roseivirga sp. TaxID=1964215 RepID=UPI002B26986B|nr:GNAT family N-acetyltransferase [Roseivirga sp.]
MIEIVPYESKYQAGIDLMMQEIAEEFTEPIMGGQKSNSVAFPDKYWVAVYEGQVIGTIALMIIKHEYGILKKMMLKNEFRGTVHNVAKLLLQTAIDESEKNQLECIYLGTMAQFKAAQSFYQKHGFQQIDEKKLPTDFLRNPIDTLFYRLSLKGISKG